MEEYSAEDLVVHHLAPEGDHRMPLIRPLDKAITLFPSLLESQKWQLSQGGCFCGCGGWGSWDITSCFFPFLRNSPQGVVRWDCFTFDQVGAVHCLFFQPGVTLIYVFHDYVSDAEHLSGAESTNYWCLTAAEKILSLFPFFFWPGFFVVETNKSMAAEHISPPSQCLCQLVQHVRPVAGWGHLFLPSSACSPEMMEISPQNLHPISVSMIKALYLCHLLPDSQY